ncbi:MAG: hypothetical protein NVV62_00900 [Terricaulis sp.]|nr:hypothetical protein [Terricaulis sp.]
MEPYTPHAVQAPQGQAYIHVNSGMVFPVGVGPFTRVGVTRYSENAYDESVGYSTLVAAPGSEIAATVYVYPAPQLRSYGSPPDVIASARAYLCASDFSRARVDIERAHPGATLISSSEAVLYNAGVMHNGFQAHYSFTAPRFAMRDAVPVRSELYVFCASERWLLKYRFTYPADYDAAPQIDAFLRGLRWTIPSALN